MVEMECLAHRGYWIDGVGQNSHAAFERAFKAGFGVETDLRDYLGEVVISHDPPARGEPPEMTFEEFLELYRDNHGTGTLALNIKADGLAAEICDLLQNCAVTNYFVFDMSTPDMLSYARRRMNYFTRQSELEAPVCLTPDFETAARGIWLDSFSEIWYRPRLIRDHLNSGLDVCLVSPELHNRDPNPWWDELAGFVESTQLASDRKTGKLMLCTDFPARF